jgi:hypothetical protein
VDAIPDIGDNQQIVFTEWPGRSPQDIEDQITYPLTTSYWVCRECAPYAATPCSVFRPLTSFLKMISNFTGAGPEFLKN